MAGTRTRKNAVLITGAAGFAGSHLIERLGDKVPVTGWYRPDAPPPAASPAVTWRGVELTDAAAVKAAVVKVSPSRVFHLAGAPSVETSWVNAVPHLRINALGTHHLFEALRAARRPCRVLVITSAQIYQTGSDPIHEDAPLVPSSPYGLTKLAQDMLAREVGNAGGIEVVIARPFNHVGPRQAPGFAVSSFAQQVARIEAGQIPPVMRVGNLDARRDISDVRDVVDAYARLMESGQPGRAYNVCSGRAFRIGDLLERLQSMARVAIAVETDPDRLRPNDVPTIQGDASRIRAELGWAPTFSIEQTLRDTLDWWRAEIQAGR